MSDKLLRFCDDGVRLGDADSGPIGIDVSSYDLVFTIDPGSHSAGWSAWDVENSILAKYGLVNMHPSSPKGLDLGRRIRAMKAAFEIQLQSLTGTLGPRFRTANLDVLIVSEVPEVFEGSTGSAAAAAGGSLMMIAVSAGMLTSTLIDVLELTYGHLRLKIRVAYLTPKEWKGNLKKDMVIKRCWSKLLATKGLPLAETQAIKDDTWDAVGMWYGIRGEL